MDCFHIKPRLYWGAAALLALRPLRGKRLLLVTDRFLANAPLMLPLREELAGAIITVFDKVTPDPSLALVAEGVALLRQCQPEAIVAFGGGSPMDCAKGIRYFAAKEGGGDIPLYCVPTTAGTGSELSSFAVLTDAEKGIKIPIVDDALLPEVSILDARFLEGIPARVTAETGMDVLTHAAEAMVAKGAGPFSDALAAEAFALAYRHLPEAYRGEKAAKEQMLYASALAGAAFNAAGLGLSHALAHSLGGRFHQSHGRLNAVLLPAVISFNAVQERSAKRYAALARRCSLASNARALSSALIRLRAALGLPARLEVPKQELQAALPAITTAALSDLCLPSNPRSVSPGEMEKLLREIST